MRKLIDRLFAKRSPATPAPAKLADALRKRNIERILQDAGLSRSAAQRATHRILETLADG